jgi:hypothetical protein
MHACPLLFAGFLLRERERGGERKQLMATGQTLHIIISQLIFKSNTTSLKMQFYSEEQLALYFKHISFSPRDNSSLEHAARDPLGLLTELQLHHMARVPFESLSLHYSRHRLLSLEPEDLFQKMVGRGRGGYCMELNTFFGTVLRSLGFTLIGAGARVRGENGYNGWFVQYFLFLTYEDRLRRKRIN